MYRAVASGIFLVFLTALNCAAQSTDPGAQPQSPSPAATPAAAPEANASSSTTSNQTKKKTKKVWTNEEMSSVGGNISVVGDASRSHHDHDEAVTPTNANTAQRIDGYRRQILQFRGQLDAIGKQIAAFHNSKPGEATTGMDPRLRYTTTSPEDRVKQLEDKKRQIQAKIDALEEAARKEGIEAGELR